MIVKWIVGCAQLWLLRIEGIVTCHTQDKLHVPFFFCLEREGRFFLQMTLRKGQGLGKSSR